jgi:hypothetical protein
MGTRLVTIKARSMVRLGNYLCKVLGIEDFSSQFCHLFRWWYSYIKEDKFKHRKKAVEPGMLTNNLADWTPKKKCKIYK